MHLLWTILLGACAPPTLVDVAGTGNGTGTGIDGIDETAAPPVAVLSLDSRLGDERELEDERELSPGPTGEGRAWPEDGPPLEPAGAEEKEKEKRRERGEPEDADEDSETAKERRQRLSSRERGHKIAGIPALRYEPSTGPQFGALLQYVWRPPDARFNKIGLLFLGHVSTKLLQDYSVELSLRDLFGYDEQFILTGLYIDDPVFPYVGYEEPGSHLNHELVEQSFFHARVRSFGGSLFYFQPVFRVDQISERIEQGGRVSVLAGYRMEADVIEDYEGSLLAFERPGAEGTHRRGSLSAGMSWDGRDNEASPTNGGLHDLTVEAAGAWTGATQTWYRVNLSTRFYRPLYRDRLIFATRLGGDALFGNPPLVTEGSLGGPFTMVGYGGTDVGRGFFRRRFIGDYKFFWTPELRGTPFRFYISRWTFDIGLNAFVDAGFVFSEEDPADVNSFHISGGGGGYINWERFFVLRAEVAGSREGVQFYLNAGHTF